MKSFLRVLLLFLVLVTTPSLACHPTESGEPGDGPPNCDCGDCGRTASPVYIKSGHFIWSDSDIALVGKPSIEISRTYTSYEARSGLFGNGWMSELEESLVETTDGNKSVFQYRLQSGLRYTLEQIPTTT